MKHDNIFDHFTNNDDVSDVAICAMYNFLRRLVSEFEMSAFYRIKQSVEQRTEAQSKHEGNTSGDPPF